MEKSKAYHLNEDQTIAHFYPTKMGFKKKLGSTQYYHSPYFISQGLCFRGEIHLGRFLDAMHETLQDFDCLFGNIDAHEGDLFVSYSTEESNSTGENKSSESNNRPFIQLEIEKKDEQFNSSSLDTIIPNKIDERIKGVITDQFEGLPMGAFKLTIFVDGFTIGFSLNHSLFDQSSMFYLIKYLSHMYTYGREKISLKKPRLVDVDFLTSNVEVPQIFENLKDFRENSESYIGFKYTSPESLSEVEIQTEEEPKPSFESYITVDLNFNLTEINKLIGTVDHYLSVNDMIHAVLLKVYSFNPRLALDQTFCFGFACNMRKYCGFGEEAIGNVLSHPLIFIKLQDIKNKSLLELALLNRQRVSEVDIEFFKRSLVWYERLLEYHEKPIHYGPTFNLLNARATNWSTFNYDNILFDNATPIKLNAPCLAPFRVNVISFENKENEKVFKTSISIPPEGIESLQELERETKLFSYENHS